MDQTDLIRLTNLGLLLAVIAPGIVAWNLRQKSTLRNIAIWLAIAAFIALLAKLFGDFRS
ncbi:MAG: hypothetical protein RIM84_13855 [Alphaproteobacteria bacterium]